MQLQELTGFGNEIVGSQTYFKELNRNTIFNYVFENKSAQIFKKLGFYVGQAQT